jgi:hypothetical protein
MVQCLAASLEGVLLVCDARSAGIEDRQAAGLRWIRAGVARCNIAENFVRG